MFHSQAHSILKIEFKVWEKLFFEAIFFSSEDQLRMVLFVHNFDKGTESSRHLGPSKYITFVRVHT